MEWVAAVRLPVVHCGGRVAAARQAATAAQPAIELPPSVKFTCRSGIAVTVAVKVTLVPTVDGLAELVSARCLPWPLSTTWDNTPLVDAVLPASPP